MLVKHRYGKFEMPESKTTTGRICFISSNLTLTNCDLDPDIHKGFTIGKGKKLYWCMIWHQSGHVTVYPADGKMYGRWISGDTEITVHFK